MLDDLKTDIVEVKLWETESSGAYPAVKEECYVEVSSYGGDTTGYQIPFNVHYTGVKTTGTFNVSTKTFTASTDESMTMSAFANEQGRFCDALIGQ